ncbi:MAG: cytochrome c oxidase subunit II [Burkholderiaceae bacterium]|nr:cytochrome c oxidase subunit II [Burkholderiaceae bacterium]
MNESSNGAIAGFGWLGSAASTAGERADLLLLVLFVVCGAVALALAVLVVWFSIRYRSGSKVDRDKPPSNNRVLETAWTLTPLAIFLGFFAWAAWDYAQLSIVPPDALPIQVLGKQWMWKLDHRNGRREINELHVPLGRPVKLVLASEDAIHSFFVPAFRLKQDVVPGRYTVLWFRPTRLGEFRLFCAEFCGAEHSKMIGRVVVMQPADYARWLESGPRRPGLAARGFELYRSLGCSGCHDERSTVHAPRLRGLLGRVVHLQGGRSLVADENYVRDSILLPKKDVVAGFDPVMPSFAGQVGEEDLQALIEWVRSTGDEHTGGRG